ncbi:MAG: 4Fe-4S single cluster domain-containing protein [Caulobacterales bacterium]
MTAPSAGRALGLSRLHFPIRSLGFGSRIGLWVQGCTLACRGCMSLDTWSPSTAQTPVAEIADRLEPLLDRADGLSITGGEPLQQSPALAELLAMLRPRIAGDIIVFTGYPIASLPQAAVPMLGLLDTLVAGPFDPARPAVRPLLGSDNQTLAFLTALGAQRYAMFAAQAAERPQIDLVEDGDGFWIAGIPRAGDLERLGHALNDRSIGLKTSAGRWGKR